MALRLQLRTVETDGCSLGWNANGTDLERPAEMIRRRSIYSNTCAEGFRSKAALNCGCAMVSIANLRLGAPPRAGRTWMRPFVAAPARGGGSPQQSRQIGRP